MTKPEVMLSKNMTKVRQSNHLIESPYSQEFSVHEIKIFEFAISKIKLDDMNLFKLRNNKEFHYSNSELAKILNTKANVVSMEIEKTAARIMKKTIHLRKVMEDGSIEFEMINIMPFARYKNGIFTFEINYKMIPYLIELNGNFTEFNLDNLLIMDSAYSIKLYKLLFQYKNIKYRLFTVNELKNQFGISNKYPQFADFKRRVLDPSVLQINTNSNIKVEYTEIKLGRKVDKLEFIISLKQQKQITEVDPVKSNDIFLDNLTISKKSKNILREYLNTRGEIFVQSSLEYAKKNAKTNFEKYLLDTLENNWADGIIQKNEKQVIVEVTKKNEVKTKQEKKLKEVADLNSKKSIIENDFHKLKEQEQEQFYKLAQDILTKYNNKLEKFSVDYLHYCIYAMRKNQSYDYHLELYLKNILDINF